MSVNLNDTVPAAPSGKTNVKWQHDGTINVSGYVDAGGGDVTHTGGALTADQPVFGGGGGDIKSGTKSGNTNQVMSATGSFTSGNLVKTDANHNAVDAGGPPPATAAAAANQFLTAYNAATGAFTKAQPTEADVLNLVSDLALKAPLASPALTGTPTAPTAPTGTNTTQLATTAFVQQEIGPGGPGAYFAWGGDGNDGAVSLDGSNTYAFASTTGSAPNLIYTLTRDVFATTLTVAASKVLNTGNFRIFARTSVTVDGTIQNNGGNAPTAAGGGGTGGANAQVSAGAGLPQSWGTANAQTGAAGKTATTGAGGVGNNGTTGLTAGSVYAVSTPGVAGGGPGGTGGSSGASAGGGGGTAGAAGNNPATPTTSHPREPLAALSGRATVYASSQLPFIGAPHSGTGASGGAGAGDGTNFGGNGGAGGGAGGAGGNLLIASPLITVNSGGTISANGGSGGNGQNGANGGAGNAAGGGGGAGGTGGPGGIVWLVYHTYVNSGTVSANGGAGGNGGTPGLNRGTATGGTSGASGNTGASGAVIRIPC